MEVRFVEQNGNVVLSLTVSAFDPWEIFSEYLVGARNSAKFCEAVSCGVHW
jgi:hypothetical protein